MNNHIESDDEEDAEERYFFHDEWNNSDDDIDDDDSEDDEDDGESEYEIDNLEDDDQTFPSAQELDGEMVDWYARSHERYIKNIINDHPVEDYGLTIPPVAASDYAAAANIDNNADEMTRRAENKLRNILNTGPIFGDSPRGEGVSCELKLDALVPHNRLFLPHWVNYTDALKECRILRLFEEFSMYKIHLHHGVASMIFSALEGKHLKKLTLSETQMCSAGFASLTEFLRNNTTLQRLTLDKNIIRDSVNTEKFGKAMRKHPQLEYLSLCDCHIGENVNALSDVLHSGMKELCLGSNAIESRGGFIIASYLASNPPMESINLERNQLNDDDVTHFANSLKTNTRLRQLTLSANKVSLVGIKTLFKAIFNPTTLNDVADCNHNCTLHLFAKFFNPIQRINASTIGQPSSPDLNLKVAKENKRNKILLALRIADSQLHYFDGVPMELMPYVMKQIHQEEVFTNKLTRIFQCVKSWIVPHMGMSSNQKQPARAKRKRG